jgi:hypothetical protein
MNNRGYEILKNLEILCFIDENNIDTYFEFLKSQISNNDLEKELMKYFENTWMKKYKKLFNYGYLINNIMKISKLYINKNRDKSSENALISNLKSLEKVYFTNNICESIHAKITKYVDNNDINKINLEIQLDILLKNIQ